MINTRAYLRRATFYVQNMQGGKNEARKEYADASFARHNGSWALEVLKRETLYTWGTATKDGEKKKGERTFWTHWG